MTVGAVLLITTSGCHSPQYDLFTVHHNTTIQPATHQEIMLVEMQITDRTALTLVHEQIVPVE